MPACTWNCISHSSTVIKVAPSVIGAVATIVVGYLGYASTRRAAQHTGTTRRDGLGLSVNETTNLFNGMAVELFGSLESPNITYLNALNGTLAGIWGETLVEIQDDGFELTGTANIMNQTRHILPREDNLTGAKVIFANAKIDGSYEVRSFSNADRMRIGNEVSTQFEHICNNNGRAMCGCLRSGYGNGWTASLRVEGQANNNVVATLAMTSYEEIVKPYSD